MLIVQNTGRQRIDISLDQTGCASLIAFLQTVKEQGESQIKPTTLANSFFNIREMQLFLDETEDCQRNILGDEHLSFGISSKRADYAISYLQRGLASRCFFPAEFISIAMPITGQRIGCDYDTINTYCKFITLG